jgi:hypothetical protein
MLDEAAMHLPQCLIENGFLFLDRTRSLLNEASRAGPGDRRRNGPDQIDKLVVRALTSQARQLLSDSRIAEAEQVLTVAVKIQEWMDHPMHEDLLSPLMTLGKIQRRQANSSGAIQKLTRCLSIVSYSDGKFEAHEEILVELIAIFSAQGLRAQEAQMRASLERLRAQNRFVIKERPNRREE